MPDPASHRHAVIDRRGACRQLGSWAAAMAASASAAAQVGTPLPPPRPASPATPPALPTVTTGRLERLSAFPSRHVSPRHVDVWLPAGYDPQRRYAVLYMHDGQMLFDARTTWNRKSWRVDAIAGPLQAQGQLRDFIVVGVWNSGPTRHAEYFPEGFLPHLAPIALRDRFIAQGLRGEPLADAYLRFLVDELKPVIDSRFATATGREDTVLMGSSMGGLISVYALCEYPRVFGAAAALSTHWIGSFERNDEIPTAALAYLERRLPPPGELRLYMDRGTTELDAQYDIAQPRIDALMASLGHRPPKVVTRVFEGTGHNEDDWAARLDIPLRFLLGRA